MEVQVLSSAPIAASPKGAPPDRRGFLFLCAAGLAGCRPEPRRARVDAAIAPLLPGSSAALAGLRIDRLKKHPWFRPFLEGRRPAALRRFEERTGLDAGQTLWEVVWSLSGEGPVAFLRGKFGGLFGLEPRFDAPGVRKRNYKSYYVLERDGAAVLFLSSGVAMMGRPGDLERIIDARDREDAELPEALIRAVAELPACEFWAVARGGEGLQAAARGLLPVKGGPLFDALEELRLHATAAGKLMVVMRGLYRSAEDARAVRDGLEAMRQMARIQGQSAPALAIAAGAEIEAVERELRVRFALGFDDWLALAG